MHLCLRRPVLPDSPPGTFSSTVGRALSGFLARKVVHVTDGPFAEEGADSVLSFLALGPDKAAASTFWSLAPLDDRRPRLRPLPPLRSFRVSARYRDELGRRSNPPR